MLQLSTKLNKNCKTERQQMFKLKKLDARGISHLMIPLAIMVLVGLVGTYLIVGSHAASCTYNAHKESTWGCPLPKQSATNSAGQTDGANGYKQKAIKKAPACSGKHLPDGGCLATLPKAKVQATTQADQGNNADSTVPTSNPAGNYDPAPSSSARSYPTAKVKKPDPRGDIVIVSYVNDATDPKADNQRIGRVAVKLSREGGAADCSTHRSGKGSTSEQKYFTRKDGTKILKHGVISFLNCRAGKYTVTTTGRSGYTVLSNKTKTFTLSANENELVKFVIQKKEASGRR